MATATKKSLKKGIRTASNFIALIPTRSIRQMLADFSGVEFIKVCIEVEEKKQTESRCIVFTSSTNRKIKHFHLVVVQRRQRNVQEKRDASAKLLFCQSKPILRYCRSRCSHRRRCLSSLL